MRLLSVIQKRRDRFPLLNWVYHKRERSSHECKNLMLNI